MKSNKRMKYRELITAGIAVLCAALLAVGCREKQPATLTGYDVKISDSQYIPNSMNVIAGNTVVWENEDTTVHTVTSGIPADHDSVFASGAMEPGETFRFTFDTTGVYQYFCTYHPDSMRGIIHVVEDTTLTEEIIE